MGSDPSLKSVYRSGTVWSEGHVLSWLECRAEYFSGDQKDAPGLTLDYCSGKQHSFSFQLGRVCHTWPEVLGSSVEANFSGAVGGPQINRPVSGPANYVPLGNKAGSMSWYLTRSRSFVERHCCD